MSKAISSVASRRGDGLMLRDGSSAHSRHSARLSILCTHLGCREYMRHCATGQLSVYVVRKSGRVTFQCRIEDFLSMNSAPASFAVGLGHQFFSPFSYLFAIGCSHS